jgi:hypothetical protein
MTTAFAPSVTERIAELEAEYDRLSDQGRDTTSITEELSTLVGQAIANHEVQPKLRDPQAALEACEELVKQFASSRDNLDARVRSFQARDKVTGTIGWALPSREALQAIANTMEKYAINTVVDCGCGHALWPALLAPLAHPTRFTAWDIPMRNPRHVVAGLAPFMAVTTDVACLSEPKPDCLSFIWPTYDAPWAARLLETEKPEFVLYIGEGWGGCTADDKFHELLDSGYDKIVCCDIPSWPGIHDRVFMYQKKPKS